MVCDTVLGMYVGEPSHSECHQDVPPIVIGAKWFLCYNGHRLGPFRLLDPNSGSRHTGPRSVSVEIGEYSFYSPQSEVLEVPGGRK